MNTQKDNKIPFGLRYGMLVEVSEVDSGLACACVCPACGHPLQARKGKKNIHHFAHDPSGGAFVCASAFETSIHLMAKEILTEDGFLMFPELTIKRFAEDQMGMQHTKEIQVEVGGEKSFERVKLEKRLGDIRPDIVAYVSGDPLIIEVAVTSFSQQEKKRKIRQLGLPAIEIDLSSVDYSTTKADLRKLIHSDKTNRIWLSHPKAIQAKARVEAGLEAEIQRTNEAYHRNTPESPHQSLLPSSAQAALPLSSIRIHTTGCAGPTRWFRCESCSDVFEVPLLAAPPSCPIVTCPNCGFSVSTNPGRTRF